MAFQSSRGGHTWKWKPAQAEAQSGAFAIRPHIFIIGKLWNSITFHIDVITEATKFSISFHNLLLSLMKALFLIST